MVAGSVALFSCSGRGFFEEVPLTRAVRERVLVDETAWVRPMLAVLDEYHRCCVIVVRSEDRSDMGALPGRNA